jgi:hypothetical protein
MQEWEIVRTFTCNSVFPVFERVERLTCDCVGPTDKCIYMKTMF